MHEFSLAAEVIRLVDREAEKNMAGVVEEVTIEVGDLSGVDREAFKAALEILINETAFENAYINIKRKKGAGWCNNCNHEFEMEQRTDTCPECKCFPSEIRGGREFRVVSLMIG